MAKNADNALSVTRDDLKHAKSAQDYAELWNDLEGGLSTPGLFTFGGCFWWPRAKPAPKEGGSALITVERVSNFTLEVDHYQLDLAVLHKPEYLYHLKIKKKGGKTTACTVTAGELSSPQNLKTLFLGRANAVWTGEKDPANALIEKITTAEKAPTVRQVAVIGFDPPSGWYINKHLAVAPDGHLVKPDTRGCFEIEPGNCIRPAEIPCLNPADEGLAFNTLACLVHQAWGKRGITALTWTWASWYSNQIREKIGFFPFLTLWGDPATGKSRLGRIINAMQCVDEEGLPLNKVNTLKGEMRMMARNSGMCKCLLEMTPDKKDKLSVDYFLPFYNGNPLQIRAQKTAGIEVDTIQFLGALCFIQNPNILLSQPQKERAIALKFLKSDITPETSQAFSILNGTPSREIARFWPALHTHRAEIEDTWHGSFKKFSLGMADTVTEARVRENHALLITFFRLAEQHLELNIPGCNFKQYGLYIRRLAALRQKECEARETSVADDFLQALLEFVPNEQTSAMPYEIEDDKYMLFHLLRAQTSLEEQYSFRVQLAQLRDALKLHPAFIKCKTKRFQGQGRHVWVFDLALLREGNQEEDPAV